VSGLSEAVWPTAQALLADAAVPISTPPIAGLGLGTRFQDAPFQCSHWVLAAQGSRETGAGVMAAGGHGPGFAATGVLPVRRPAP